MTHTWHAGNRKRLGTWKRNLHNANVTSQQWWIACWPLISNGRIMSHMVNFYSNTCAWPVNQLLRTHCRRSGNGKHLFKVSDSTPVCPPSKTLQQHNSKVNIWVGPLTICLFHIKANTFSKCACQIRRVPVTLKTNKHILNGQNGHHAETRKWPTSQ